MGALIQLVSFGTLDVALVGSPDITFFRSQYRQYSNFAMESIEQVFNGTADYGKRATSIISRSADLMAGAELETTLPLLVGADWGLLAAGEGTLTDGLAYTDSVGHAIIDEVTLKIGGNDIDKQYGEWLEIVSELTINKSLEYGYNQMVGKSDDRSDAVAYALPAKDAYSPLRTYWTPLRFFFEKPGLAIPLIALEFNEVKITFDFASANSCVRTQGTVQASTGSGSSQFTSCKLYVDYIFLENEERAMLIDEPQSYLITQIQKQDSDSITWSGTSTTSIRLNFNLPCKELIWVAKEDVSTSIAVGFPKQFSFDDVSRTYEVQTLTIPPLARPSDVATITLNGDANTAAFANLDTPTQMAVKIADTPVTAWHLIGNGWTAVAAGATVIFTSLVGEVMAGAFTATFPGSTTGAFVQTIAGVDPVNLDLISTCVLQVNNQDRFSVRPARYFQLVQPYHHHTKTPEKKIHVYSFALNPEAFQPSGSLNYSKVDNSILKVRSVAAAGSGAGIVTVYAVNLNTFNVREGVSGLGFAA